MKFKEIQVLMKIIYCVNSVGRGCVGGSCAWGPTFVPRNIDLLYGTYLAGGWGRKSYLLPLFRRWKGILDRVCSGQICWSSFPSTCSCLGDHHSDKWTTVWLMAETTSHTCLPFSSFSHIIKFCHFYLKMCPESWIFPLFSVFIIVIRWSKLPSCSLFSDYHNKFIAGPLSHFLHSCQWSYKCKSHSYHYPP